VVSPARKRTNDSIGGNKTLVTVVWQAWLKEGKEAEGISFAQSHWSELQQFDSCISHRILIDEDAPVISRWKSRQAVDEIRARYANPDEPTRRLTQLLARPMERWYFREDTGSDQNEHTGVERG
jgi:hypothetical protein